MVNIDPLIIWGAALIIMTLGVIIITLVFVPKYFNSKEYREARLDELMLEKQELENRLEIIDDQIETQIETLMSMDDK